MRMGPWVDFGPLVAATLAEARSRIAALPAARAPRAVTLLRVGEALSPAQVSAYRYAERVAEQVGVQWRSKVLAKDASPGEVLAAIRTLNHDGDVVGIVASRPMESQAKDAWWGPYGPIELKRLHRAVNPLKDVEGLHPLSLGNVLYKSQSSVVPCTARAALELAVVARGPDLRGLEALVIGGGDVVAKPLFAMLQAKGATVTAAPPDAPKLPLYTRAADAVFSCVGLPGFEITADMLRPGALLLDLGLKRVGDILSGDVKLDGDESVLSVVSSIATVPRGIAKLRTALLFLNVAAAAESLK